MGNETSRYTWFGKVIWKQLVECAGRVEGEIGDQEASAKVGMGNGEPLHKGGVCTNREKETVLRGCY